MSIAAAPPPLECQERLLTCADLAVLPEDLPSGPVRYELDDGRLIVMAPPGILHGRIGSNIVTQLKNQGEFKGLGIAINEAGLVLRRNPDKVFSPDCLFIANRSLPFDESPEGYLVTIPDLVVEVRSKNDSLPALQRKMNQYLAAGVTLVWLADPQTRTITAYRRDVPPQVFAKDDTLVGDEVIPGFRALVADLFPN